MIAAAKYVKKGKAGNFWGGFSGCYTILIQRGLMSGAHGKGWEKIGKFRPMNETKPTNEEKYTPTLHEKLALWTVAGMNLYFFVKVLFF
jgi:hypothetical protein